MSERNPLKTDEELARALDELFDEIPPPKTPEEVDAVLREAGFDPHEVATRMEALAERALANSPLNWRNRDQEMEEARTQLGRPSSIPRRTRSEILTAIQQILTQLGGEQRELVTAHFRNLEQATDEDLASLLAELEFLADQQGKQIDDSEG